jgi:hypothetical protein
MVVGLHLADLCAGGRGSNTALSSNCNIAKLHDPPPAAFHIGRRTRDITHHCQGGAPDEVGRFRVMALAGNGPTRTLRDAALPFMTFKIRGIRPRRLIFAVIFHACFVSVACGQTGPQGTAYSEQPISFDIPAQPLPIALSAFSKATGIDVLVDARRAAGRQSIEVKGLMRPRDALTTLLMGSSLVPQSFSRYAVTLKSIPSSASSSRTSALDVSYFVDIQRAVRERLCNNAKTRPGHYRLAVKLWIGTQGTVLRVKRLDTTGDPGLDVALDDTMSGLRIGQPPPPGVPQPLTLVVSPRQENDPDICLPPAPDTRRASTQ